MEAADGGWARAAGGGRKLLRPAADVPLAVLLPPQPAGHYGRQHGGSGGRGHVQQHVPDSLGAAPRPAEASGPPGADPRPRAGGAAGSEPPGPAHAGRAARPIETD